MNDRLSELINNFSDDYEEAFSPRLTSDIAEIVSIAAHAEGYAEGLKEGLEILREQYAALERRTVAILETLAASRPELIDPAPINETDGCS